MNITKVLFFCYTRQPCTRSRLFFSHISSIYKDNLHVYDHKGNPHFLSFYLHYITICFKSLFATTNLLVCIPYHCHLLFPFFPLLLFSSKVKILVDYAYPLSDISGFPRPSILKVYLYKRLEYFLNHERILLFFESPEQASRLSTNFQRSTIKVYYTIDPSALPPTKAYLTNLDLPPNYLLFRGRLNKESGILNIIKGYISLISKKQDIPPLLIHGWGSHAESVSNMIHNYPSIVFINRFITPDELNCLLSNCLALLGQTSSDNRLNYTIPHKFFEALVHGKPYISPFHPPLQAYFYGLQKSGFPLPPFHSYTNYSLDKVFASLLLHYLSYIYSNINNIRAYNFEYFSMLNSKNNVSLRV
jgi:glycosyltransferase involved in cell wall biosynthesis